MDAFPVYVPDAPGTVVKTDIIVLDPPWYLEYYKLFISIVCLISKLGSAVLIVMPSVTTRPTIEDEYVELEEYLKELGIYISEYKSNIIEYEMPPFERKTLQVNGIINIPDTWRTGDLLIATKRFKVMEQKLLVQKTNDDKVWAEFDYGAVRIKYCVPDKLKVTNGYIELRSIYRNDIYPSVSRRDQKCDLRLEMKEKESINKYVYNWILLLMKKQNMEKENMNAR